MSDSELRLECLRLASNRAISAQDTLDAATSYVAFVKGLDLQVRECLQQSPSGIPAE